MASPGGSNEETSLISGKDVTVIGKSARADVPATLAAETSLISDKDVTVIGKSAAHADALATLAADPVHGKIIKDKLPFDWTPGHHDEYSLYGFSRHRDPGHRKIKEDKARSILSTDHHMHVQCSPFHGDPGHSKFKAGSSQLVGWFPDPIVRYSDLGYSNVEEDDLLGFFSPDDHLHKDRPRHGDPSHSKIKEHGHPFGWSNSYDLMRKSLIAAKSEFRTKRQKQGESIVMFAAKLRELAIICHFSRDKDQKLLAQFVNGLRSMHIRDALERRYDIEFESAVHIASVMEESNLGNKPTGDSEVKEKKPRSIERADQKLTADRLQDELVKSLLPPAIEARDITELVAESSASFTQQVESGISKMDECLSEIKKTGLGLDIRMKLLLTICDTCMFAGQFHKAAEIVSSEELTSADMRPLNCQTRVVYLRLLCCAAEANALLYNREQVEAYYLTAENIIQDLPQKLNDDVYEDYKEVRCRLDKIEEKLISNYHRDHRNSITQRVGKAGGVLELPDCSIYFPNYSFLQSTLVHAMTTKVSDDTPPSMVPVTPVLRLSPNTALLDPAIVKLVTWVSSENPVLIHVYHKHSENSTWSALPPTYSKGNTDHRLTAKGLPPTYSKGNNRIEFQITQFCSFCGFVDEKLAHRTEFKIMSRLFFSKERKELANRLFPCCDTHKEAVKTEMREKSFSEQACSTDPILTIKENDEVEVTMMDVKHTNDDRSKGQNLKSDKVKIVLDYLKRDYHRAQNLFLPTDLDGLIEFNHSVKQFRDGEILNGEDNQHQDRIDFGNSGVDNRGANINAQLNNPIIHVNKDAHIGERDGFHDHRKMAIEERADLKTKPEEDKLKYGFKTDAKEETVIQGVQSMTLSNYHPDGNFAPPSMTRSSKDVAKQIDSTAQKEDSL